MSSGIQVLSAGAVKTGVAAAAAAFAQSGLGQVSYRFATAPSIRAQMAAGEAAADVVVVPPGAMSELERSRRIDGGQRIVLGRVGAGVAIRAGAAEPRIDTVDALEQSLADADSIVFNKASTGLYIEGLLERLGLLPALEARIVRQDNGAGVMNYLLAASGRDIGFGAITEILVFGDRGIRLVGPLPAEIQNYTRYEAAPLSAAADARGASAFVAFLAGPRGREILREAGIEPAD